MKKIICMMGVVMMFFTLVACSPAKKGPAKIGVSFGVGAAARWEKEAEYMKEEAKKLDAEIEVRINRSYDPKDQENDCKELVDSGIDVLVLIPRDATKVASIISYAKEKDVKVISYARAVANEKVDLYIGYDSYKIGQMLGQFLTEVVYEGNYLVLKGDQNDNNGVLLYDGAMDSINKIKNDISILDDRAVTGWNPEVAKEIVREVLMKNNNQIDAILAPNDAIAQACAEVLQEMNITKPVAITGMDCELSAVQRIVSKTQSVTVYMDLEILAKTAIREAVHMAKGEKVEINTQFDNGSKDMIDANLIVGKLITNENVDKNIIEKGVFTKEEVYGK